MDLVHGVVGEREATVASVLTLVAIALGSGCFPVLRKRPGRLGAFAVGSSLKGRFDAVGPFAADDLIRRTPADCADLFGQDREVGPVDELMGMLAGALNDLGRFMLDRFGRRRSRPIKAAAGSAERLIGQRAEMPLGRDGPGLAIGW